MRTRLLLTLFMGALLAAGCSDTGVEPERAAAPESVLDFRAGLPLTEEDAARLEQVFDRITARAHFLVRAGESIQDAVDRAHPGAVIHIEPGIYAQSVVINKPNLRLLKRPGSHGDVILENPGGLANGITVQADGDGIAIAHVTTRGYGRNGILMLGVEGFFMLGVTAEDNGEYGIYPIRSSFGAMIRCKASGHADAGLYIGQSEHVSMLLNSVFGNVIGIEISNSKYVAAHRNEAYENTIGIFAVLLPPSPRRTILVASDVVITQNRVEHNNLPNFADPSELPAYVPRGSGILVVGTDRVLVEHNVVRHNDWVGIGVGSTATLALLAGLPPEAIEALEPDPDYVVVRRNLVAHNGENPPPPPFPLPGADLFWDGTGTSNCWQGNGFVTSFPPASFLPSCG
ncbi:MAG TPA: parallel beta-helix domain-containing protein [Longimicrobiaceae bacterium]|nr:parallel beta-helix domain-containing protein [Longimicrobiaceae bacterium]